DQRLRQVLGYPAVFLGTSPFRAPSLYHLMSRLDLDGGVLYPKGGFVEVIRAVERLARGEGVRILTGSPAIEVLTTVTTPLTETPPASGSERPRTVGVRYLEGNDATSTPRELAAEIVVVAGDLADLDAR